MATHAPLLGAFAALTLILCWPLVLRLHTAIPFDLGDPLLSTWMVWWNATALPFSQAWWDGLAFFPTKDTITFSDHRLGLSPVTTTLIWLGVSPLATYNVAFLLSFVLSAIGAYALAYSLTKSRDAAFIAGLVFGFNPFRAEHLPHLELLSAYWLPIVLLALHQWTKSLQRRWLAVMVIALTMQAFTSSYYFLFLGVLIALWVIWFRPWQVAGVRALELVAGLSLPFLIVAPVLFKYREVHLRMGLFRALWEIEVFSADVIGLITAPLPLAFWNTPERCQGGEGAILPGVTAAVLIGFALIARRRQAQTSFPPIGRHARTALLIGAVAFAAVALVPLIRGPTVFDALRVSVRSPDKPFSIATLFFGCWAVTSVRILEAWKQRSVFGFFVLATIAMWVFALGPTGTVAGHQVLYKAPYSWLMVLPGFRDELRAPARFAMLAALTLSVAAALAFVSLTAKHTMRMRTAAVCVIGAAILFESWIFPFPVVAAPTALIVPAELPDNAAILELPLGTYEDAAAMYHSIAHRRRTVNGMSGYELPHYEALRAALEEGRVEALEAVTEHGDVALFVRRDTRAAEFEALLVARTRARRFATTMTHEVFLLPETTVPSSGPVRGRDIPIQTVISDTRPQDLHYLLDDDRLTTWATRGQVGHEWFSVDLGEILELSGVSLGLGRFAAAFPRVLAVDISLDGATWAEAWQSETAAMTVAAGIDDPRDVMVEFPIARSRARHVRLRQLGQSPQPWVVAEFRVWRR